MLSIYWFSFAIGGVFVLLAVLSGVDGADFGDQDLELHLDDDVELVDADRPRTSALPHPVPWYAGLGVLKSLKFWTFGLCFFGLTGLVLSHLSFKPVPLIVLFLSVLMGLACGALVAGSLRLLRRRKSDSLVRSADLVGSTGTVELPFDKASRGKVRLRVKGNLIDSIAYTDENRAFQRGDRVLVVSTEQNRLWVVSADHLNQSSVGVEP